MRARVKLGGVGRLVSGDEFLSSCERWGVRARGDGWGRVVLSGPSPHVERGRVLLAASPELEAAVLLELAKGDANLRDILEERRAIRWADGLSDDLESAALVTVGGGRG